MLRGSVFSLLTSLGCALLLPSCVLSDFKKGEGLGSEGARGGSLGTNEPNGEGGGSSDRGGTIASSGGASSGGSPTHVDGGIDVPTPDLCLGVTCEAPPKNTCADAEHLVAYDKVGTCSEGSCQYTSRSIECECEGDRCKSDPCVNVLCNLAPATACVDVKTQRVYSPQGTCTDGSCSYAPMDSACQDYYHCVVDGCVRCDYDAACGPDCSPCGGATPYCTDNGARCSECSHDGHCSPLSCINGKCTGVASCQDALPDAVRECSDSNSRPCCEKALFAPVLFNRGNDPDYPASIRDFTMEHYEVTVGRFRQFVGSYESIDLTSTVGRGRNPNNLDDKGWLGVYAASLPKTRAALIASLKCDPPNNFTWTDDEGVNETKPINCVNWATAYLFCIWAGGRLPTEAEWNFAAAGLEQNEYPWGAAPPETDASRAAYGGHYYGMTALDGALDIAQVGVISRGINGFAQRDMAGNVAEWTVDAFVDPYPEPCFDCAFISGTATGMKVVRGGSWRSSADELRTTARGQANGAIPSSSVGFRCAGN